MAGMRLPHTLLRVGKRPRSIDFHIGRAEMPAAKLVAPKGGTTVIAFDADVYLTELIQRQHA